MPETPQIRFYRRCVDPSLAGVKEWIARWYEEPTDFLIRVIPIECPTPERLKELCKSKSYKTASQRNESPLHSYLKFIAWTYLDRAKSGTRKPRYEAQMYFPTSDLLKKIHFVGNTFDPSKAQVIAKGRQDVFCSYGDPIHVDVYVDGCSAEVGCTQPYNLCMPLLERLVTKVIWLPFPKSISPKAFNPMTHDLKSIVAYEIKASPSSDF